MPTLAPHPDRAVLSPRASLRAVFALACVLASACGAAGTPVKGGTLSPNTGAAPHGPPPTDIAATLHAPARHLEAARIAVRPHVSLGGSLVKGDGARVASRTRAALERHPEITTYDGRTGLPLMVLDANTACSFEAGDRALELRCVVRYALSDGRGKLLSSWRRSVRVSGARGDGRDELLDDAVDHALAGLPEHVLSLHDAHLAGERPVALAD